MVVGLNFKTDTAFLCEVVTHIRGLLYGRGTKETLTRIANKHKKQRAYAKKYLGMFQSFHYQLWSPVVRRGLLVGLEKNKGLELCINQDYTKKANILIAEAKKTTKNTGNPAFRMLQILAHMRTK